MKVLGIESTCDETAAAVIENGKRLLSNVVHSQIDIHAEYGGVVPEVAARSHIEMINPVIHKALADANCNWDDIDAIAVAYAPGLIGSLLVGTLAARTLAILHNKPLYAVHHVEAHVYANFLTQQSSSSPSLLSVSSGTASLRASNRVPTSLEARAADVPSDRTASGSTVKGSSEELYMTQESRSDAVQAEPLQPKLVEAPGPSPEPGAKPFSADSIREGDQKPIANSQLPKKQPTFPILALIVSGGHSQLVLFRDHGDYQLLGQTTDDAVGEAFDKVAKIIGLPYPGGPAIAKAALSGDPKKYQLPKAKVQGVYDFSFSGLKTAVLRAVQRETGVDFTFPSHQLPERVTAAQRADFAASFQQIAVETLVDKTEKAFRDHQPASVVIAGGVAANQELRRQLSERLPLEIEYAPMQLCTDNAAMIASLGYYHALHGTPSDPYSLEVVPSLSMKNTSWRNVVNSTT